MASVNVRYTLQSLAMYWPQRLRDTTALPPNLTGARVLESRNLTASSLPRTSSRPCDEGNRHHGCKAPDWALSLHHHPPRKCSAVLLTRRDIKRTLAHRRPIK